MTEKLEQLVGNRDPGANEALKPARWTRPPAIGAPQSAAPAGEVPGEDRGETAPESLDDESREIHPSQANVMARRICRVAVLGAPPTRPMKPHRLKTSSI